MILETAVESRQIDHLSGAQVIRETRAITWLFSTKFGDSGARKRLLTS